jgi:S-(hydroxymethyl)glutathione dehydrogenase/alcohol dehydrogenase
VRTAAVGLCHSDYNYIEGAVATLLPVVLGHEVSGVVEAVGGEVSRLKPGDHVVGCLSVFCGHCDHCVTGRMVLCQDAEVKIPPAKSDRLTWRRRRINQAFNPSGFAEQLLVHEHALVRIRPDMPLDCAALIGCSVLTGTGAVFRTAGVEPNSTVAVIGCGGVGLAVVMGAAMAGALRVIAIDRLTPKLELAREFGATDVIETSQTDAVAEVMSLTSGG